MTRRIRKIGYTPEVATRFSVYLTYLIIVIFTLMGATNVPAQQTHESNHDSGNRTAAPRIGTLLSAHDYALRH